MILDASVVVRWFLWDEPYADRAATLRQSVLAGGDQAIVPGVCWMEVSHALARAVRRGRLPNTSVEPVLEALAELMPLIDSHDVDPVASLRIALGLRMSAYDSAYLALSGTTGQSLITADRRLFEVGAHAGYDVIWLGDLPDA